jgi:hypothetical protein
MKSSGKHYYKYSIAAVSCHGFILSYEEYTFCLMYVRLRLRQTFEELLVNIW